MNELLLSFLEPNISLQTVVQNTFNIQLIISRESTNKNSDFASYAQTIYEMFEKIDQFSSTALHPFLSIAPLILYRFDPIRQTYINRLLQFSFPTAISIPLFHSISELNLTNQILDIFIEQLTNFSINNPKSASSMLNIALYMYESKRDVRIALLIRKIFHYMDLSELPDCVFMIRQRRSHSHDLVNSIETSIRTCLKHKSDFSVQNSDVFFLFTIVKLNLASGLRLLRFLIRIGIMQTKDIKDYNFKLLPPIDIIDCICGICSDRNMVKHTDYLAQLFAQIFISSEYREIITFALYNQDESPTFLTITYKAIDICAQKAKNLLLSAVDLFSILYSVNSTIQSNLLDTILRISASTPDLMDQALIYLKKLAVRNSSTKIAINKFCFLLSLIKESMQIYVTQILNILFQFISVPFSRNRIFKALRSLDKNNLGQQGIDMINDTCRKYLPTIDKFKDLISYDQFGNVVVNDTPSVTIDLLIYLGADPREFLEIKKLKDYPIQPEFDVNNLLLLTDVFAILAPYDEECFKIFCDFSIIIAQFSDGIKIQPKDWIEMCLNPNFALELFQQKKSYPFIYQYFILDTLKQIQLPENVFEFIFSLFMQREDINQHFMEMIDEDVRLSVLMSYRESLVTLLCKENNPLKIDLQDVLNNLEYDISNNDVSTSLLESYANLLQIHMNSNKKSVNKLLDMLRQIEFTDPVAVGSFVQLVLIKSPRDLFVELSKNIINDFASKTRSLFLRTKSSAKSIPFITMLNCLSAKIQLDKKIKTDLFDLLIEIINPAHQFAGKTVMCNIYNLLIQVVKLFKTDFPENYELFIQRSEAFAKTHARQTNPKQHGLLVALLTNYKASISGDKNKRQKDKYHSLVNPYGRQKWRSTNKFIDQALREQSSDDDDNYADLEGFIVESDEENANKTDDNAESGFNPEEEEYEEELDEESQRLEYELAMQKILKYKDKFGDNKEKEPSK